MTKADRELTIGIGSILFSIAVGLAFGAEWCFAVLATICFIPVCISLWKTRKKK